MLEKLISNLLALTRRLRTRLVLFRYRAFLVGGGDLHIGKGFMAWAPDQIDIGTSSYIGKDVTVECNASIGAYCLLANRVAFVGRHDHDFRVVGVPVRFSPWIGSVRQPSKYRAEKVTVEDDVWIGFASVVLSGVRIGRGAVVAAASLVVADVAPYSIVGGVPARPLGRRFDSDEEIARHERMIRGGHFESSEHGFDHFKVMPGAEE